MWEADEKRFLEEVRDAIEKASGKRPRGWMAPWMASTRWTPDLLKEVGFDFLMDWPNDDQPLWMKTRSGPLMSVPYPIEINDSPQILVRHHSPDDFRDFIIGQFEELLRQSAKQPLVCGIALHTMIVGQPYRLRALREALQHIANHPQKDKVWFTRPGAIYDHCAALPKGTMVPPPGCKAGTIGAMVRGLHCDRQWGRRSGRWRQIHSILAGSSITPTASMAGTSRGAAISMIGRSPTCRSTWRRRWSAPASTSS